MHPAERLKIMLVNAPDSGLGADFEEHLVSEGHDLVGKFQPEEDWATGLIDHRPDLLVISTAVPDQPLLTALEKVGETAACPIIVYSASNAADEVRALVQAGANAVAAGSGRHTEFRTLVDLAVAEFRKTSALRHERDAAITKLAERKLVERAKGIIMKERNLGEDEAYRLLRKLAMDRSEPLIQLANKVIEASRLLK